MVAKTKKWFYFAAVNPSMLNGGMFGNTKSEMYLLLDPAYVPLFVQIDCQDSASTIHEKLVSNHLEFPLMAKPEVGERGYKIQRILDEHALKAYHQQISTQYLLQKWVNMPLEISIFIYKLPGDDSYTISSIVGKELLSIVGDGQKTIGQLIEDFPRARLQISRLYPRWKEKWNQILDKGERLTLTDIANHSKGARFYNLTHHLTSDWNKRINQIILNRDGFNYGRFDLRCCDVMDFPNGKPVCIIELNGMGAEPIDMYEEGIPLSQGISILLKHWKIQCRIAEAQLAKGIPVPDAKTGFKRFFEYKRLVKHSYI